MASVGGSGNPIEGNAAENLLREIMEAGESWVRSDSVDDTVISNLAAALGAVSAESAAAPNEITAILREGVEGDETVSRVASRVLDVLEDLDDTGEEVVSNSDPSEVAGHVGGVAGPAIDAAGNAAATVSRSIDTIQARVESDTLIIADKPAGALLEKLGEGSFGSVHLVRTEAGEAALKRMRVELSDAESAAEALADVANELAITARFSGHPNSVSIHTARPLEMSRTEKAIEYGILMERLGPSATDFLTERMKAGEQILSLNERVVVARHFGAIMSMLDEQNVLHCDLKPANLAIVIGPQPDGSEGVVGIKVFDFGEAMEAGPIDNARGTPAYMAPEQMANKGELTTAADRFAMGIMLLDLLYPDPPFSPTRSGKSTICSPPNTQQLEAQGGLKDHQIAYRKSQIADNLESDFFHGAASTSLRGIIKGLLAPEAGDRMGAADYEAGIARLEEAEPRYTVQLQLLDGEEAATGQATATPGVPVLWRSPDSAPFEYQVTALANDGTPITKTVLLTPDGLQLKGGTQPFQLDADGYEAVVGEYNEAARAAQAEATAEREAMQPEIDRIRAHPNFRADINDEDAAEAAEGAAFTLPAADDAEPIECNPFILWQEDENDASSFALTYEGSDGNETIDIFILAEETPIQFTADDQMFNSLDEIIIRFASESSDDDDLPW